MTAGERIDSSRCVCRINGEEGEEGEEGEDGEGRYYYNNYNNYYDQSGLAQGAGPTAAQGTKPVVAVKRLN